MNETLLIALPFFFAVGAFVWPNERTRPLFLPVAGILHAVLALWLLINPPAVPANIWFSFDPLARAVLPMTSLLFLVCSFYGVAYLRMRAEWKNRVFVAALLVLLGLLSLALQAQNLGLLWVATEAATLVSIPLLHFNGTTRAFEAAWKYLLIGGTGIALSLLGSFCLGYASLYNGGSGDLSFAALAKPDANLSTPWVTTAWVLLLTGYGTKMGLAPMHTWKPDAYGEAPGMVGALMAGGMTTMAFVAILRVKQVVDTASAEARIFTTVTLLALGLFSMLIAALFLLGTPDFKRMLAYSSVEHMGILAIGAALGSVGTWAALFHVWTNSLTKGALFLSAANIRRAAGSQTRDSVAGMAWRTPNSARILVVGILAITACPPFGPFFSEMKIVVATFSGNKPFVAAAFLLCLLFAFFGLTRLVFAIVDGRPRAAVGAATPRHPEAPGVILPALVFLALSLWLGLATPAVLRNAWTDATNLLYNTP
jgi:hydrogenase-4 component F